ncbi:MAG: hypothetical protein MJ252_01540 [archaeon]|nr:hypothetical protein [archaeon]
MGPIPNPQSPIPNSFIIPSSVIFILIYKNKSFIILKVKKEINIKLKTI